MPHWKLTLSYDGSPFHGWQVQPGSDTVQGRLAAAFERLLGEAVLPQGSGRTDAGVHALAQVASVTTQAELPAENLLRALNRSLPGSIRVLAVERVAATFHARHSAVAKMYEYRIFERRPGSKHQLDRICSPFHARFCWDCPWPLATDAMNAACPHLLGTHDFTSFAASDPDRTARILAGLERVAGSEHAARLEHEAGLEHAAGLREKAVLEPVENTPPTNTRTLHRAAWAHDDEGLLAFTVTGSGFLHHMVRNLVGTLVEVGRGALAVDALPAILAARNRSAAGPTAPAQGLFLHSVQYPAESLP